MKTAETISLDNETKDSIHLARTLNEINTGKSGKQSGQMQMQLKVDSQTLVAILKSTKQVEEKTVSLLWS